jgi:hypothetical protein
VGACPFFFFFFLQTLDHMWAACPYALSLAYTTVWKLRTMFLVRFWYIHTYIHTYIYVSGGRIVGLQSMSEEDMTWRSRCQGIFFEEPRMPECLFFCWMWGLSHDRIYFTEAFFKKKLYLFFRFYIYFIFLVTHVVHLILTNILLFVMNLWILVFLIMATFSCLLIGDNSLKWIWKQNTSLLHNHLSQ